MKKVKKLTYFILAFVNMLIQNRRHVNNCYITYAGKKDGAGSQIHNVLSILLFAKKFKLTYLHSPLKNIAFPKGSQEEWDQLWENFFNLGLGEKHLQELDLEKFSVVNLPHPSFIRKRANTIYKTRLTHLFTEYFVEEYESLAVELRKKFYANKARPTVHNEMAVAVHVRRGDVKKNDSNTGYRFSSDEFILRNCAIVERVLKSSGRPFRFHIYSVGAPAQFQFLEKLNPIWHLNEDEFQTITSLATADVLIMAKSSFSYIAALLSEGLVLFEPFWHRPLKRWIKVSDDDLQIERQLLQRLNELEQKATKANKFEAC